MSKEGRDIIRNRQIKCFATAKFAAARNMNAVRATPSRFNGQNNIKCSAAAGNTANPNGN